MKRPQGFDKPANPAAQPRPAAPAAKPSKRGGLQAAQSRDDVRTKGAQRDAAPAPAPRFDETIVVPSASPGAQARLPQPPRSPGAPQGTSSAAFADARENARADSRPAALPTAWWMAKNEVPDAVPPAASGSPAAEGSSGTAIADATTEPIAVVANMNPAGYVTGPLAPVTQLNTAAHPLERPSVLEPGGSAEEAAPAEAVPATGSARARLRAATRARKAYERAEVRRFTKHLRRRRAAWLTALGAVLALALFVAIGTFSPLMALTTIQIEGTSRLNAVEVADSLDAQLGTPLPLIDFGEVKTGLSQFSLIQSFSTESRPPNTLVIRIVERDPIGAIAGPNGFDLVDPAGVVIQNTAERPAGYPLVEAAGSEGLAAAGSVVQALPPEIRTQLDIVRAASTDDVNLVLADGSSIAWGSAEDSAQKAFVLAKLIAAAPPGGVSLYDVSSPASPVVR